MWKLSVVFLLSMLLITSCIVKSVDLKNDYLADDNKVFRDSFSIRGKTIPLPPGDWKIMASGYDYDKFFRVFLVQEHNGKLFHYITIQVDSLELNREYGYNVSEVLNRKNMHHVVVVKNIAGEEREGWYINNFIIGLTPKEDQSEVYNDAAAYFKSHNYLISNDCIEVGHILSGKMPYKKRLLIVRYMYNPEIAGFPPSQKGSWETSDWNAMRVNEDPRKVEYIKELIKKHTDMHEKIKAGFHTN